MAFNGARAFDSLRPRFPVTGNFSVIFRSGEVLERILTRLWSKEMTKVVGNGHLWSEMDQ